jgi:hypothetical protein
MFYSTPEYFVKHKTICSKSCNFFNKNLKWDMFSNYAEKHYVTQQFSCF